MFQLTEQYLAANLNYFLCDYGAECYTKILIAQNFSPESFTVYEKMNGKRTIYFRETSFEEWCEGLVWDQISKLTDILEKDELKEKTIENVLLLLEYRIKGEELSKKIYNQEFVDIIRRVMYYTLYGKCDSDIYTAKEFNELAFGIMPKMLEIVAKKNLGLQEIFRLSVASGLMGLDMKGAPSAASNYANAGIVMKRYIEMPHQIAANELLQELEMVAQNADTPVFYWDKFIESVQCASKIVWMTDDYIETFFDLFFIEKLIEEFPKVNIDIIPKNGRFGNDMSWIDLEYVVSIPIFAKIKEKIDIGQISINHFGPQMGAANLTKLSKQCIHSINDADFVITKGCRIHEMIQGGINKKLFSAYIVTRELSQIVTGYDSKHTPILLLYAEPGEYLFWGVNYENAKEVCCENGKHIFESYCTIREHETRKKMHSIEKIVSEYNRIYDCLVHYRGDSRAVCQELEMLKNKINCYIMKNYTINYHKFVHIHSELSELDRHTWNIFIHAIKTYLGDDFSKMKVLDVAAGSGRDLLFGQKIGFEMIGCDNCVEFIKDYNDRYQKDAPVYVFGDAYQLPFDEEFFSVVRQNASLVHIPIICKGYGADLVVKESYRVLKKGGLLYLTVKKGKGIHVVDTGEGLDKRVFQYFRKEDIIEILSRNNFAILSIDEIKEMRVGVIIEWIVCIAIKKS